MYRPYTPTKSQSPYSHGRKNPEYRNPTFTHQSFQTETDVKQQLVNNGKAPLNTKYYTYYNQQQKLQNQKAESLLEKQRYSKMLKVEEVNFGNKYSPSRVKQHSQHEFYPDHSLNRIKRNSQFELNTYWNNGKIENEIKKEIIKSEKKQLFSEIEQTEEFHSAQQGLKKDTYNYKTQCYLTGLDMQNKYNSYLKEVEKTKQMEEEIVFRQEIKIQELRRQQELLRIAKQKFTQ